MVSPGPSKFSILNRPVNRHASLRPERRRRRNSQFSDAYTLQFETLESRHLLASTIENFAGLSTSLNPDRKSVV